MKVELIPVSKIKPAAYNPRADLQPGEPEYEAIKNSLDSFGLVDPLIWNKHTGNLVGGHQRFKILKDGGAAEVWCSVVDIKERAKEMALNISLNKVQGRWDDAKLQELLPELTEAGFHFEDLGFRFQEIEALGLSKDGQKFLAPEDEVIEPPKNPITKPGDLYILGQHRLLCGDSTNKDEVETLMHGEKAVLMNTDPPYGVDYGDIANSRDRAADKKRGGTGKLKRDKFIKNDDLDGEKLQLFLETCIRSALPHLIENPAFYLWHPMLTQGTFFQAAAAAADILIHRQIIWVKPSLIMGRGDYHWRHELCFYGWVRGKRPAWYMGRDQDTVWECGRENDGIHPTQKPIALFERPIANHTRPGEVIYEPFSGSGSQFIAAEKHGRRCFGLELDPGYCDVIVERWENFTGKKAKRV